MHLKKAFPVLFLFLILLPFFLASCAPQSVEVAVIVALTQTAAVLQTSAPPVVQTQPPAAEVEQVTSAPPTQQAGALKGFQPFNADACNSLSDALFRNTGNPTTVTSPVPFNDYVNNMPGLGCQIAFSNANANSLISLSVSTMQLMSWQEDTKYSVAGPSGVKTGFRQDDTLCLLSQTATSFTITCSTYIP